MSIPSWDDIIADQLAGDIIVDQQQHTLTLFVPIYGLFRTHAHARCFRDLMRNADISGSISPVWAVLMVLVSGVLGAYPFALVEDSLNLPR